MIPGSGMKLAIRNMVCPRCVAAVEEALRREGIPFRSVVLGEAEIGGELSPEAKARLAARLAALGFELLEDRRSRLVEAVRRELVELVWGPLPLPDVRLSDYLADRLHIDYNYLSTLFSETRGVTIEHCFIALKIERVKELLVYDELTLGEIAFRLGYSSTAYLSAQFKRMTGLTPSAFRRTGAAHRRPLDEL